MHPYLELLDYRRLVSAMYVRLRDFPYNGVYRFVVPVRDVTERRSQLELQDDGTVRMNRFGQISFDLAGNGQRLSLFWVLGYGGGLFLPFRDATAGQSTYGGGRYLLDTIKQADLGNEGDAIVIDFNFAYNPKWSCPLSPQENTLAAQIPAGEMSYDQ